MENTSAYLDGAGRPVLRASVTGFLDVLGFSNMSVAARSREESQLVLAKIAGAIGDSRAYVRAAFGGDDLAAPSRWALKFFSDNLVFGFPFDEAESAGRSATFALRCVQGYQLRMALNGFFVRGAMTAGDICLTDEIIFGPALVECYRLESNASIVPRVLVNEPLREAILAEARSGGPTARQALDWACRDVDGWWFVNYLQAAIGEAGVDWQAIQRHKEAVLTSLGTTTRHDVLPKFGWACRYHNVFCHWHRNDVGYLPSYRIERSDEDSTIDRLSDLATP